MAKPSIDKTIPFFLIALVLFTIEFQKKVKKARLSREQKAELKANGIKRYDKATVAAYFAENKAIKTTDYVGGLSLSKKSLERVAFLR